MALSSSEHNFTFFPIDGDLESPAADELSLDHVAEEEGHQARVDLVLHGPGDEAGGGAGRVLAQVAPGVEVEHDHGDDCHLEEAEQLAELDPAAAGVVVVARDGEVGVRGAQLLAQHGGQLPVHLLVTCAAE